MNTYSLRPHFIFTIFLFVCLVQVNAHSSVPEQIEVIVNQDANQPLRIGQNEIAVKKLLVQFYQLNEYQPAWNSQEKINVLLNEINNSELKGLSAEDYHYFEITNRFQNNLIHTDSQKAQLDILLTDSLLRLIYHLRFGKVVPGTLDPNWNFNREFLNHNPVEKLHEILQSSDALQAFLKKSTVLGPLYKGIMDALAHYRQIKAEGGWPSIPEGKVIKPGMKDVRIPLIKQYLKIVGDLEQSLSDVEETIYSITLEEAVKRYQKRHTLEPDGVIGNKTLKQMNITVDQRIDQIKANLERVRWVKWNVGDEFVLVNIAGYKVYYVRDKQVIWKSRVQVGRDFRQTPVFRDDIKYLVFNPTWTVPPTIFRNDVLPKIKKDTAYLKKNNMSVVDLKGKIIDQNTIDWSTVTANRFPYMIRQEPGSNNALGQVKIMFPNKNMVYLHDTPSKNHFNRAKRSFSSGCIRVENPFELVELLLKDSTKWNRERFDAILGSGKMQNVNLPVSVPVLLLYFTVIKDDNGRFVFYKDIYNRDEKIIKSLSQPFHLVMPEPKS